MLHRGSVQVISLLVQHHPTVECVVARATLHCGLLGLHLLGLSDRFPLGFVKMSEEVFNLIPHFVQLHPLNHYVSLALLQFCE